MILLHAVEQWIQADENIKKTISEIDYFTVDMDVDACVVSKNMWRCSLYDC